MIKIKDLETYFETDFNTLLNNNDIVFIASNVKDAVKSFIVDEFKMYNNVVDEETIIAFEKWLDKCSADELLYSNLDYYQRYFKVLDNGNIYYLNNYI